MAPLPIPTDVDIRVLHTADLPDEMRVAARQLLFDVFDDMEEDDWEHSLGGMHAVAVAGSDVIGHASVIQRRVGYLGTPLRTGYVEGVAVRRDWQGRGIGSALMTPLERIIGKSYDIGALGSTDEALEFYAHRGWRRWQGLSYGLTPAGPVRTEGDEECIFVLDAAVSLDLTEDLAADWRPGDLW